MKKLRALGWWTAVIGLAGLVGAGVKVQAAVNYGSGFYTNLCGTGTAATAYTCDPGCNPAMGSCSGGTQNVVRWICSGRWDQCVESESGWSNFQTIGEVSCNKTVQISLFDKKCRREDGSWDSTCQLKGYMVWYSGECSKPTATVNPINLITGVPSNTVMPTSKTGLTSTVNPTATLIPVSTSDTGGVRCGSYCSPFNQCSAGLDCIGGVCLNPVCREDESCQCTEIEPAKVADKNPETGPAEVENAWWLASCLILGLAGRKWAKKIW